jgi:hypothetical protein
MNQKKIFLKFRSLIHNLRARKNMYVSDNTYISLVSFIDGYLFGVKDLYDIDISYDFKKWLEKKIDRHFTIVWSIYIVQYLCNKDEAMAEEKLFNLLEEYLEDKNTPFC